MRALINRLLPQPIANWKEELYYGRYGEPEMHLVDLLCRSFQGAVDVGANVGGYVHFMRHYATTVTAYEPMPEFFLDLKRKFGRAGNVKLFQLALSDRTEEADLWVPLIDNHRVGGCATLSTMATATETYDQQTSVRVKTVRLDDFHRGTVGFMKIDVEGYEESVISGAWGIIRTYLPRLLIEIDEHLNPGGLARMRETLEPLGYCGWYVHDLVLEPIESFSMTLQNPDDRPDLNAKLSDRGPQRYLSNFIFLPTSEAGGLVPMIKQRLRRTRR